ncbi:S41 family peptidase [Candidatus Roizmanbacteria bacterium]|jgi:carboxyl-terminal processing protease|nr:S41 family peptidase [Candidatus Roizmanbacteria bacterium]
MKNKITNWLLILSLAVFLFGSGYKIGEYKANNSKVEKNDYNIINASGSSSAKNVDFSLFWETWNKVEEKYIDKKKLDSKKMFYGAIKGMVNSLEDPYTYFLTPDENKSSKDDLEGKFDGIGAQLGLKDYRIVIVAPLKDSPAEKAGLKSGDFIVKIDGQPTKDLNLNQAVLKIRGQKGTKVKLTLERSDKEFDAEIVRDVIKVQSVELSYEKKNNKKIAYLKLNQFGENTKDEWNKKAEEIKGKYKNKEVSGMVLDLRDNPGGYLEGSVYVASEFLPFGKTVVKQESTVIENKNYQVLRNGALTDIPLVVLINKGSASASEILSGALRDYKRAKLVGENTFGKGSVQEPVDLSEGAGLHVTVAKWILPNGDWINGKGIAPDIKAENQIKDGNTLTRENDKQLDVAITELLK